MSAARSTLILGGARSGKSRLAERLCIQSGLERIYVATSAAWDEEMRARIDLHKQQRGDGWTTLEEQMDLAGVLVREAQPGRVLLVDCLTLWLTNVMLAERDLDLETNQLAEAAQAASGPCVFVSNETGLGIVPENRMARTFRDAQGRLNQAMAEVCSQAIFVTAGQPIILKPRQEPEITL